jgi:hypothetical protein
MGRARLDGDVPLGCIRPSVRTLDSGSPSRMDISLRSRRSSVAGRTARILADATMALDAPEPFLLEASDLSANESETANRIF